MIGLAVKKGSYVEVYDENGHRKCSIYAGDGPLQGYTSTTVNIKKGSYLETYDEDGHRINSTYVG